MDYVRPTNLYEWRKDEPDSELYTVSIRGDETILSACGRYAQGSGSRTVTWQEFADGEMQELVRDTMGQAVLDEVIDKLNRSFSSESPTTAMQLFQPIQFFCVKLFQSFPSSYPQFFRSLISPWTNS